MFTLVKNFVECDVGFRGVAPWAYVSSWIASV